MAIINLKSPSHVAQARAGVNHNGLRLMTKTVSLKIQFHQWQEGDLEKRVFRFLIGESNIC